MAECESEFLREFGLLADTFLLSSRVLHAIGKIKLNFWYSWTIPELLEGTLVSILFEIRNIELWQEAFSGWSMYVTARRLGGREVCWIVAKRILDKGLGKRECPLQRDGMSSSQFPALLHKHPRDSESSHSFHALNASWKMQTRQCFSPTIYYLYLDEFWPHKARWWSLVWDALYG